MSYFPFFIEIEGKRGVIVDGGKHAAFKVEKLAFRRRAAFGRSVQKSAPLKTEVCDGKCIA